MFEKRRGMDIVMPPCVGPHPPDSLQNGVTASTYAYMHIHIVVVTGILPPAENTALDLGYCFWH